VAESGTSTPTPRADVLFLPMLDTGGAVIGQLTPYRVTRTRSVDRAWQLTVEFWPERMDGLVPIAQLSALSWQAKWLVYEGHRYLIHLPAGDPARLRTLTCYSWETALKERLTNTSAGAFSCVSRLPSEIGNYFVGDEIPLDLLNGDFGAFDPSFDANGNRLAPVYPSFWNMRHSDGDVVRLSTLVTSGWNAGRGMVALMPANPYASATSSVLHSNIRRVTPGRQYRIRFASFFNLVAQAGSIIRASVRFWSDDLSRVIKQDNKVVYRSQSGNGWVETVTNWVTAASRNMDIVFSVYSTDSRTLVDNVRLFERRDTPLDPFIFLSPEMDVRTEEERAVAHNDERVTALGGWTDQGEYLVSSAAGDLIDFIFTGADLQVRFGPGTSGTINFSFDGMANVLSNWPVTANQVWNLSSTLAALSTQTEHYLTIEVASGTVRLGQSGVAFYLTSENRVSLRAEQRPVHDMLAELQSLVGGEYSFAPDGGTITLKRSVGSDRTKQVRCDERTIISGSYAFTQEERTYNRVVGTAYGEGEHKL